MERPCSTEPFPGSDPQFQNTNPLQTKSRDSNIRVIQGSYKGYIRVSGSDGIAYGLESASERYTSHGNAKL